MELSSQCKHSYFNTLILVKLLNCEIKLKGHICDQFDRKLAGKQVGLPVIGYLSHGYDRGAFVADKKS